MNSKLTALIFLGLIAIAYCGWINEEKIQKKIDERMGNTVLGGMAKAIVHKMAKNEFQCMANMDMLGNCEKHCQTSGEKGYCHGTKCKCGTPLSY
uniref:Scorpine n=1 Tax=Pandinus imperator TaxID=55084 RepID=KBX3_PANIM|nr:RecName: Full=Scorpine; Short=Scorpin; AltName: Full=Panscorpine; Flags: Precursor [Pandinus imperator]CAB96789.1 scorpin defensin [Pandinus imperator]